MYSSAFSAPCFETLQSQSTTSFDAALPSYSMIVNANRLGHGLQMVSTSVEESTIAMNTEITMRDVVEATSIEMEQLKERERQCKTPFELFEQHDQDRTLESEQVGLDRLRNDHGEQQQDHWGESGWGGSIDPDTIVSWNELKALIGEGIHSSSKENKFVDACVRELYRRFQTFGGFLVVQLDESDASIVSDMWSTMEEYFSLSPEQLQVDTQILKKDDGSHDPEAGYHFRQTYMNMDGEVLPETIQNTLEGYNEINNMPYNRAAHDRGIEGSYKLFADITKTVGTIVAAGALDKDLPLMDKVATSMLDDRNGHPFVNADHRLSRYILSKNSDKSAKESLISHTDWTFTTCIPLSAIPGLQVWKPNEKEWIVPEAILGGKDRCSYVVVMAGKWIELLTQQKITSCVHRVVTMNTGDQDTAKARLSAPFFCRTKRSIFDTFQDEFDESWEPPSESMSENEAIASIGQLFANWIRFLEGDRDPDIQGCVVDLCLDQEERAPACFSVEDVL